MGNPGPSSVNTTNTNAVITNTQFTANPPTQAGQNLLRLLGSARGMSVAATGDAAVVPITYTGTYSVANVIVTNSQVSGASGSIAAGALGVFTAAAAGGTAIVSNATLTGVTGSTVVSQRTVASTAALTTAATPNLYVNVGTAVANGTCDVFIYGYDLT